MRCSVEESLLQHHKAVRYNEIVTTTLLYGCNSRRSDWLMSEKDFLVLAAHYEIFSRLDGSLRCEAVKYKSEGENKK